MPFKKEKRKKTAGDYAQKSVYLNLDDAFQKEAFDLFTLCGHKQARFLGLLAHDFIMRHRVDLSSMTKNEFSDCIRFFEMQVTNKITFNSGMLANGGMSVSEQTSTREPVLRQTPPRRAFSVEKKGTPKKEKPVQIQPQEPKVLIHENTGDDEDFISKDDMDDMNKALAEFGI